ncbi:MAG: hypothetical protein ACXVYI_16840, partial [Mycobacterium sp.]
RLAIRVGKAESGLAGDGQCEPWHQAVPSERYELNRMKGERVFATLDPRLLSPGKLRPDRG